MMAAYYNEIDPGAAQWLRNLIAAGQIAPGDVDTRSITEVQPDDLRGYTQCHFFAGVGGWSYAARLAGWPDDRPLWSGSCPCQPFSVAGKGAGIDDVRHLWPDFFRLIRACRPDVVVGEQVAGAAGYGWLDGVAADLAGEGYASGAVDIPACAVDAPHIRQRLYWVAKYADPGPYGYLWFNGHRIGSGPVYWPTPVAMADAESQQRGPGLRQGRSLGDGLEPANGDGVAINVANSIGHGGRPDIARRGPEERTAAGRVDGERTLVDTPSIGRRQGQTELLMDGRRDSATGTDGAGVTLGDACGPRLEGQRGDDDDTQGRQGQDRSDAAADGGDGARTGVGLADAYLDGQLQRQGWREGMQPVSGRRDLHRDGRNGSWWRGADWIVCHDGKARRVADASAPLLAHGVSGGVAVSRPLDFTGEGFEGESERQVSRIAAWKGFGNAIVPALAAEVLGALMDVENGSL